MISVRFLTRRIDRAFPELDSYDDETCRRFVRAARRGFAWLMHAAIIFAVAVAGVVGGAWATDQLSRWLHRGLRPTDSDFVPVLVTVLGGAVLMGVGPLLGFLVRDRLHRRRLRFILRNRGSCPACSYKLIGLTLSDDSCITCPECGLRVKVDAALGELARDGSGRALLASGESFGTPLWRNPWFVRLRRWGLRVLIVSAAVLALTAGAYEWLIRDQAARASRAATSLSQQLKTLVGAVRAAPGESAWDVGARAESMIHAASAADRLALASSTSIAEFVFSTEEELARHGVPAIHSPRCGRRWSEVAGSWTPSKCRASAGCWTSSTPSARRPWRSG